MNGTAHLLLQRKTGSSDALPFSGKRNHYFSGFVLMGTDPLFWLKENPQLGCGFPKTYSYA